MPRNFLRLAAKVNQFERSDRICVALLQLLRKILQQGGNMSELVAFTQTLARIIRSRDDVALFFESALSHDTNLKESTLCEA
jgi:hypothetical protein